MNATPPPVNDSTPIVARDAPLTLWHGHEDVGHELAKILQLSEARHIDVLSAISASLTYQTLIDGRLTSYPRRAEAYSNSPSRYRNRLYTRRKLIPVVDALAREGLIEHFKASPGQLGWQSSMRATERLLEIVLPRLDGKATIWMPSSTIRLKDTSKTLIDYRDTSLTENMQRDLDAANEALISIDFGHRARSRTFLVRIFNNGNFNEGGRFYSVGGSYQILPKHERQNLLINGEKIVEIDYSQLHVALAYMTVGMPPKPNAYDLPGFPRQLVKIAFNVMLNCNGNLAARRSLATKDVMLEHLTGGELSKDAQQNRLRHMHRLTDPCLTQMAFAEADKLVEAIERAHEPIAKLFYTGIGLKLQRIDSDMAACVMRSMRKKGEITPPVHDSFLVRESQASQLEEAMIMAAEIQGATVTCKRSSNVSMT